MKKRAESSRIVSRRRLLRTMAGASAALAFGARPLRAASPKRPDIQHIVLVMMENRSFDHFLGWAPGADGEQAGLTQRHRARPVRRVQPRGGDRGWTRGVLALEECGG